METKFNIYVPKRAKWLTMNKVAYVIGTPISIIYLILQKAISIPNSVESIVVPLIFTIFFITPIVWGVVNYGKIPKPNKILKGELIFTENCLSIKGKKIELSQIQKIEFRLQSYLGEMKISASGNFGHNRENGIENWLIISFKEGTSIKLQFQRLYEDQLQIIKPFLINMYKNNKISLIHITELLGIDKYEDIQEFKKEIKLSPTIPIT